MFIANSTGLNREKIKSDISNSESDILSKNLHLATEKTDLDPVRSVQAVMKYTKKGGFFKGLLLALPVCLLLWGTFIWTVKALFF